MTVLITQSNYIPWKGYFDNIALADAFVIYDDVQYTKRDWRNRNMIKAALQPTWLTIPVKASGKFFQLINETVIADAGWNKNHLSQLKHVYAKARCFKEMIGWIEEMYLLATAENLSSINTHFLTTICSFLGIQTQFYDSSIFVKKGNATERLVFICEALKADHYITGPAAKNYMDESVFEKKGIKISYVDYGGYPEYPQLHPPFQHHVSILDVIFNCGYEAAHYLKYTTEKSRLNSVK